MWNHYCWSNTHSKAVQTLQSQTLQVWNLNLAFWVVGSLCCGLGSRKVRSCLCTFVEALISSDRRFRCHLTRQTANSLIGKTSSSFFHCKIKWKIADTPFKPRGSFLGVTGHASCLPSSFRCDDDTNETQAVVLEDIKCGAWKDKSFCAGLPGGISELWT